MNEVVITVPVLASRADELVRDPQQLKALDGVDLDADYSAHIRTAQACTVRLVFGERLELEVHWFTKKKLATSTLEKLRKDTWTLLLDGVDGYEVGELWVAVNAMGKLDEVTATQQPGKMPLLITQAAKRGNLAQVKEALSAGQPIDKRYSDGRTPLHLAYEDAHLDVASWLIEQGAPLDLRADDGRTPLLAVMTCMVMNSERRNAAVAELLAHGADPTVADKDGCDALWQAARIGDVSLVETFLDLGLDPNRRGHEGRTAAMVTLAPEILQRLLEHGLDLEVRDDAGRTLAEHLEHSWEDAKTSRFGYPDIYPPLFAVLRRYED